MRVYLLALSPVLGLAVNTVALTVLYRVRPSRGLLRTEYFCFGIGLLTVAAINLGAFFREHPVNIPDDFSYALLTSISYAALGYCHFHFVNLGETARRIRLLRELHQAGGSLSHGDLLSRYNSREIMEKRIARLLRAGQIVFSNGSYHIGDKTMVRIARFIVLLKIIMLGRKSEYDE